MSYIYDDFSVVSESRTHHHKMPHTKNNNEGGGVASETPRLRNSTRKLLDKNSITPSTSLHKSLSSRDANISSLRTQLLTFPSQASVRDERGRLPLHLLSLNKRLLLQTPSALLKRELKDFITDLVKCYPEAVIARDNDGFIPFSYSLIDWITFEFGCGCHNDSASLDEGGASRRVENNARKVYDNGASDERSIMSGILKQFSFFKKSDIQMHMRGMDGEGNEDAPSVSAHSATHSAAPSACNSTWSYRHERRSDIRSIKRLNTHHKTYSYSSYYNGVGHGGEACSISSPSPSSGPSAEPNTAPSTTNHHESLYNSNSSPSIMQSWVGDDDAPPLPSAGRGEFTSGSGAGAGGRANDSYLFPKEKVVKMTELVLTSLEVLDHVYKILQSLPQKELRQEALHYSKNRHLATTSNNKNYNTDDPQWLASAFLSTLSATPNLAKLLHFCDCLNPENKFRDISIVPLILTSPEAIDNWIVYMIESTQFCDQGVAYLELFDFYGNNGDEERRGALFEHIEHLDYILPSLLALARDNFDLLDRAAQTTVWEYICRENLVGRLYPWVMLDFVMRLVLIVTFHSYTHQFLTMSFENSNKMTSMILFDIGTVAVLYLWLRKMNHYSTIFKITSVSSWFWRFVAGFWHVLDLGMLCLSFGMLLWMHFHGTSDSGEVYGPEAETGRKLLGLTTVLIWVELLGWLRLVNWDVAFFMGILVKVFKDIRYYIIIVAIFILSFSELFRILDFQSCPTSTSSDCNNTYLQTYSTFFGSFDVQEYTTNPSTIVLFIIFTSVSLFLLLTTLLSLVYNSFSLASLNRHHHRPYTNQTDRLIYLTHTKTIHTLFTTPWTLIQCCAAVLFLTSLGVSMILSIDEQKKKMTEQYGNMTFVLGLAVLFLFMLVSMLAFLRQITFYNYTGKRDHQNSQWYTKISHCFGAIWYPLKWATQRLLLGYDQQNLNDNTSTLITTTGAKWRSPMIFLEETMQKQIASSENHFLIKVRQEMNELEHNIEHSSRKRQADLITEMQSSQNKMKEMMTQMQRLALEMKSTADTASSTGFGAAMASRAGSAGGRRTRNKEHHHKGKDNNGSVFEGKLGDDMTVDD
eukprot:CAMPEP_0172518540 /NCGR_PEP_ID=MMETSP1066-20121228/290886_1 /TAXON_ID=671091 /ORGANISM="Coscinodiscus wailesii, Strain CCMP2513" /LENGTH=1090 /DNA_ID=CAMNT_0013300959 /DNA_START=85 /DNA_END=3357 /DNA_ORIENTATION=+